MFVVNSRIILKSIAILIVVILLTKSAYLYGSKYINQHAAQKNNIALIEPKYLDIVSWITTHSQWFQYGNDIGWAGFDRVYFITLEERLVNVRQVSERLGIANSASIFKAIHKKNLNMDELLSLNIIDKEYLKQLKPRQYGAIAAHLSHFAVMLDCLKDDKAKTCVIFEDDIYKPSIEISAQIIDLHKRVNKIHSNWDMLYLDYSYEERRGKTYQDVRKLKGALGNHAYVIKKKIVPMLVSEWFPMRNVNDVVFRDLMRSNKIISVGPDKARYFAQNRRRHGSTIDPGFLDYEVLSIRYM